MADGFQKSQGLECGCRSLVGAGRLQPVSAGAAGGMDQSWRVGAGTTGLGLHHLWCAASDVDGPRHSVVERACPERSHAPDGVADEARHSTALERLSPSPDAGQGGTLSWRAGTGSAPARGAPPAAASLAGSVSLGTQSRASARGAGHANSGQCLVPERAPIRSASAPLGISAGCQSAEGQQSGQSRCLPNTLADRPRTGGRVGTTRPGRTPGAGLLLSHSDSRTGSANPILDPGATLASSGGG